MFKFIYLFIYYYIMKWVISNDEAILLDQYLQSISRIEIVEGAQSHRIISLQPRSIWVWFVLFFVLFMLTLLWS